MRSEQRLAAAKQKTWDDVQADIIEYINQEGIKIDGYAGKSGLNFSLGDSAHFTFSIAWAVECDLRVHGNQKWFKHEGKEYVVMDVSCDMTWSSTGRNVSCALAAIDLYSQVVALAAKIEAKFNKEYFAAEIGSED